MKTFSLLFYSLTLLSFFSKAQQIDTTTICYYNCTNVKSLLLNKCRNKSLNDFRKAEDDINPYQIFDSLVYSIMRETGANEFNLKYVFKACDAACTAAAAKSIDNKYQYIFYNPEYVKNIRFRNDKKRWALLCIFGHEIGHQIMKHTEQTGINKDDRRRNELRADFFSGYIISRFPGTTLKDAFEGLSTLDSLTYKPKNDSEEKGYEYPTLAKRRQAIQEGFEQRLNTAQGIAVFANIKAYALEKGIGVIYRTTDAAFKNGELSEVGNIILEYAQENDIDLNNLPEDNDWARELKKKIKKKTGLKPLINQKGGELNLYFKGKDLKKLEDLRDEDHGSRVPAIRN